MVQMASSSGAFSSPTGSGYRPFPARSGQNPFAMAGGTLASRPPELNAAPLPALTPQALSARAAVTNGRGFAPQAMVQFSAVPASPLPEGTANPFFQGVGRVPSQRPAQPDLALPSTLALGGSDAGWLATVLASIARLGRVVAQVATGQAPTPDNPAAAPPQVSRGLEADRSALHKNQPWERPVFLGYRDGKSLYGAGRLFILG